jgi:redox-sensitive bicupin YhaK (pirin superfamily)
VLILTTVAAMACPERQATDAGGDAGDFAATDPFLALMEDWFPRGVFGKHPHRGIETVTYVVEGRIDHYDNQGHEGTIWPGDVQWMTACWPRTDP